MGQSSSSRRRRYNHPQHPHPSHYYSSFLQPPPPPPPSFPGFSPIPPQPSYSHVYPNSHQFGGNPVGVFDPLMGQSNYPSYYQPNQGSGWWPSASSSSSSSSIAEAKTNLQPAPSVDNQKAATIKNDVNLHRHSIRLEPDEQNPDCHLISFTFDSLVDGSFTIFYFAKEGNNCTFSPVYPEMYIPIRLPFRKGLGQNFRQPSGYGIDLEFFELDDLSKPSHEAVFPLVVCAEACSPPLPMVELIRQPTGPSRAQITQAVIVKSGDGSIQVKVMKQILWVDGGRYELQEIFGVGISAEADFDDGDGDPEKECVICMSEPRDTALLPCRHMCMCSECAKLLRLQYKKCPICRQPIEKLLEIKNQRRQGSSEGQGGIL